MNSSVNVLKGRHHNHSEKFDRSKLYGSLFQACLSARIPEGQAEMIADKVCERVINWLEDRHEITTVDIRTIAAKYLREHSPEAGHLYERNKAIL